MTEWWTSQQAGWIGAGLGLGGSMIGVIGAVAGFCIPRGIGFRSLTVAFLILAAAGIALLGVGVAAGAVMGQPYHVWYPLVLGGCVCAPLCAMAVFMLRKFARMHEQRRLDAEELRRG